MHIARTGKKNSEIGGSTLGCVTFPTFLVCKVQYIRTGNNIFRDRMHLLAKGDDLEQFSSGA